MGSCIWMINVEPSICSLKSGRKVVFKRRENVTEMQSFLIFPWHQVPSIIGSYSALRSPRALVITFRPVVFGNEPAKNVNKNTALIGWKSASYYLRNCHQTTRKILLIFPALGLQTISQPGQVNKLRLYRGCFKKFSQKTNSSYSS